MVRSAVLFACLALSPVLMSCTSDPCTSLSTCAACAGEYIAEGCKWCPSDNTCSAYGDESSCSYSELTDEVAQCAGNSSACDRPYSGPTADPQSSSFCQAAYHYGCQGRDSERSANCQIYAQFEADNPGLTPCPYCP
ncbi:hypothetical protein [Myxococcus sp. Y35]|uniref:hypothetical protein n=1 Tax=Pseudomyxococcus flavus TaxID=3115648 RepID=UPI003CF6895E